MVLNEGAKRRALAGTLRLYNTSADFQVGLLQRLGLPRSASLLDYGCGPLRAGLRIIRYLDANKYVGFESRHEAWAAACGEWEAACAAERRVRTRSHLSAKQPLFIFRDWRGSCGWRGSFDWIWCNDVVMHQTDSALRRMLGDLWCYMHPKTRLFLNANVGPAAELGEWQGFPVVQRPSAFYTDAFRGAELHSKVLGTQAELGFPKAGSALQLEQIWFELRKVAS